MNITKQRLKEIILEELQSTDTLDPIEDAEAYKARRNAAWKDTPELSKKSYQQNVGEMELVTKALLKVTGTNPDPNITEQIKDIINTALPNLWNQFQKGPPGDRTPTNSSDAMHYPTAGGDFE
jgi:hypothetical protein